MDLAWDSDMLQSSLLYMKFSCNSNKENNILGNNKFVFDCINNTKICADYSGIKLHSVQKECTTL